MRQSPHPTESIVLRRRSTCGYTATDYCAADGCTILFNFQRHPGISHSFLYKMYYLKPTYPFTDMDRSRYEHHGSSPPVPPLTFTLIFRFPRASQCRIHGWSPNFCPRCQRVLRIRGSFRFGSTERMECDGREELEGLSDWGIHL